MSKRPSSTTWGISLSAWMTFISMRAPSRSACRISYVRTVHDGLATPCKLGFADAISRRKPAPAARAGERSSPPIRRRLIILGAQLKPDDGDSEKDERDDQRAKRVREVHVIGFGLKPGEEAGKAVCGGEPIDDREAHEHEPDNADDPCHWLGHADSLTEGRAGRKGEITSGTSAVAWGLSESRPRRPRARGSPMNHA